MITILRAQYETFLLDNPNGTIVLLLLLIIILAFSFFGGLFIVIRLFRAAGTFHKQLPRMHFGKKISIEPFILTVRVFLRMVDSMEQRVMRRLHNVVDVVSRVLLVSDREREH